MLLFCYFAVPRTCYEGLLIYGQAFQNGIAVPIILESSLGITFVGFALTKVADFEPVTLLKGNMILTANPNYILRALLHFL